MTPEQMATWVGEFITKNNSRLTEVQRQNFQLCQQMLQTQQQLITELSTRQEQK